MTITDLLLSLSKLFIQPDLVSYWPTDLPFNKRVYLPAPLDEKKELKILHLRDKLENATNEYVSRVADEIRLDEKLNQK